PKTSPPTSPPPSPSTADAVGTFHSNKHELHGITVVVETEGPELYVGRCDDMDDERVFMIDVDVHSGDDDQERAEYLKKAAEWGVFAKHKRLTVDRSKVTSIRRLGEL
ncbi:MAG: hypothetical protein AAFX50_09560, partial [Acidobacteriota bacterium]